ncbi:peroxisomal acyl-coenzyme A oxidase 1-like [Symsagittifera roscoffensis]|uniref:peroxisomal acyl-coenzyme A oxidase 1-like n=1 Tax=Symsagittifera roscoffensis TaxID=84072 RepID=UPI00307C3A43
MFDELEKERQLSGLDAEELRVYLADDRADSFEEIKDIIARYPEMTNPTDLDYLNADRKEKYEINLKRFSALMKATRAGDIDPRKDIDKFYTLLTVIRHPVIGLHISMVVPTLEKLMTDEQWAEWEPLVLTFKAIFAYAQTEVGHGTWLSKLETTAEFDHLSDEFVINSNGLTGYKYWPGYLAKGCSHALVMAQLIVKGQNLGPHLFVVPVRCTKTYKSLPGIDDGDIGPTYSIYERDNGFVGFKEVRIPRKYMLMRYQSVDKDGNYRSEASTKLMFAGMLKIRSLLVPYASMLTTIGTVVATRYSIVRRQCELIEGEGEMRIVDYVTQQDKLYPAICLVFALQSCHKQLQKEVKKVEQEVIQGVYDGVTPLHYLLAGLKAFASSEALKRLTVLRGACGGHGFSLSSNIPPMMTEADAMCTYEGDNVVMHQQCARSLVRCFLKKTMGEKQVGFMKYLDNEDSEILLWDYNVLMNLDLLRLAYEQRARYVLTIACKSMQNHMDRDGCSKEQAWINSAVQLVNASIAHSHLYVASQLMNAPTTTDMSPLLSSVLRKVCILYCLIGIRDNLGEFLACEVFRRDQTEMIFEGILQLYMELRPHILKLAEGFGLPEFIINSTIGASDGRAYERLMEWSRKSSLNDKKFKSEMFEKYLKPVLKAESKL